MNGIQARIARNALGIGMRDLAKKTKIAPNTISRLENGDGSASGSTLDALERYYLGQGITFAGDAETVSVTVPRDMQPRKSARSQNARKEPELPIAGGSA